MPATYGYVKGTEGADGDHVDVYVGDNPDSDLVFVVDQVDADSQEFDEHKAMLGFDTIEEAEDAYNAAFNDGRGPERQGNITEVGVVEFKNWLENGNTDQPFGLQADQPLAEPVERPLLRPRHRIPPSRHRARLHIRSIPIVTLVLFLPRPIVLEPA